MPPTASGKVSSVSPGSITQVCPADRIIASKRVSSRSATKIRMLVLHIRQAANHEEARCPDLNYCESVAPYTPGCV